MNELNKAELRSLAEAAMPGDWFKAGNLLCFDVKTGESHGLNVEDDRFIAAANPAAVLSLLDQCDGLMAQHARDSVELSNQCHASDLARRQRDKAEAERAAALAELEACRNDAGRYRWITENCDIDYRGHRPDGDYASSDEAIDAAMAKESSQ